MVVRRLLLRWVVLSVAFATACALVPSVHVLGGVLGLLAVAALYGLVNAVVGTALRLLTAPLTLVTLGLSLLGVNAVLLLLTAGVSDLLTVGGFLPAVAAALIITVVSLLLHLLTGDTDRQRRSRADQ